MHGFFSMKSVLTQHLYIDMKNVSIMAKVHSHHERSNLRCEILFKLRIIIMLGTFNIPYQKVYLISLVLYYIMSFKMPCTQKSWMGALSCVITFGFQSASYSVLYSPMMSPPFLCLFPTCNEAPTSFQCKSVWTHPSIFVTVLFIHMHPVRQFHYRCYFGYDITKITQ